MNMRKLGHSGLSVSEVGLGCEHLQGQPAEVVKAVIDAAIDSGITLLDVFMSEPEVRTNIGTTLVGRRDKVQLQGHIGAAWIDGQYSRTRKLEDCRFFFEDFLTRLQTDYVDIGMIHFVDTEADCDGTLSSGMLEYAQELKAKGTIRAIGVSSHDPIAARRMIETGIVDVLMFSINPAYDILPPDTVIDDLFNPESYTSQETFTITPERLALYQACEARGVGITVMKAFGGGALLHTESSPYGTAMSVAQCIHYALTRPAVGSVLVGCRTPEEVRQAAAYETATEAERDYSTVLSTSPKFSMAGKCVYCNHCLPCPSHIDIAQVNKYLDLAEMAGEVPGTVRTHYAALDHAGKDCIACGQCEPRCPFDVKVIERMQRADALLG